MSDPDARLAGRAKPNGYGLAEALLGLVAGLILEAVLVGIYDSAAGHQSGSGGFGSVLIGLIGLWTGFVGAALIAVRRHRRAMSEGAPGAPAGELGVVAQLGVAVRPLVDVPLGIAVGLASQYLLVPVLEAPLYPFVPHLYERLGNPAKSLTMHVHGPGLVVLGLFICLGSPLVEELYFRGLIMRGLLGAGRRMRVGSVVGPLVLTGLLFGLAHFEALQFLGLAGFGVVLSILAYRTGRLGPGVVAHIAFNTVTFVALARLS